MPATFKVMIPAGPIWNNDVDAKLKGPIVAAAHGGTFTGQWVTVIPNEMSVVEVEFTVPDTGDTSFTMDVPAGPIWNNDDAQTKGPVVCASYGGKWNGQWKTIVPGKMSVCGCTFNW